MGIHHLNKILRKYSPNSFREIPLTHYAYKKIAIEKIPNIGLGKTINDRIIRASKF